MFLSANRQSLNGRMVTTSYCREKSGYPADLNGIESAPEDLLFLLPIGVSNRYTWHTTHASLVRSDNQNSSQSTILVRMVTNSSAAVG